MTRSHCLTLVVNRAAGTLAAPVIDAAREMVKGAAPVVLSAGEAVDIPCGAPGSGSAQLSTIRAALNGKGVDVLLTRARGRRKGLLIADMDSTIVTGETLDELAEYAGIGEAVRAITARSMNGEMNFEEALRARVALLRGKPEALLERAWADVTLNEGAKTLVATMRAHNATTALISGGFTFFTARVAELCGFAEHHANHLGTDGDVFDGTVGEPIVGPDAKLAHLERLSAARGLKLSATLCVGDGANDLPMLRQAGLGVAFHAKPVVRQAIEQQVNHAGLRALLFAQGYTARDLRDD
ncbi:phosphoserine phosphatase [Ameyamaea chiangmaiensis NBRC 103196]|uniref:Phosphoserine phosphatase n=1 Tax=Ameyamaea chiangmaiensis TaxID=442969 RepID=A0A850PB40_9PROT|nr:phosphoserine phosphatase SerB [Ameyamaea chiangmaiensis]MBS4075006.1 phosphoserine phosphatase SerB [Ameyamaea chiangmaiensis]NVN41294.1 phosphoserine phosphatase SerB [Ameyamaea chiangmaiensis]GBQ65812.1 phosphoserine phosphatase [Ameyamaea chiangmaiensis NBRC 103196]